MDCPESVRHKSALFCSQRKLGGAFGYSHPRIHEDCSVPSPSDHEGIQVEFRYLRDVFYHLTYPKQDLLQGFDVLSWSSSVSFEYRKGSERPHHLTCVQVGHRGQSDGDVPEKLHQRSPRSAGYQGPEVGVVCHANEHLHGIRNHLLYQEGCSGNAGFVKAFGHLPRCGFDLVLRQTDLDRPHLSLVKQSRRRGFQHHLAGERPRNSGCIARRAGHLRLRDWDPVAIQEPARFVGVKPPPAACQRLRNDGCGLQPSQMREGPHNPRRLGEPLTVTHRMSKCFGRVLWKWVGRNPDMAVGELARDPLRRHEVGHYWDSALQFARRPDYLLRDVLCPDRHGWNEYHQQRIDVLVPRDDSDRLPIVLSRRSRGHVHRVLRPRY